MKLFDLRNRVLGFGLGWTRPEIPGQGDARGLSGNGHETEFSLYSDNKKRTHKSSSCNVPCLAMSLIKYVFDV